jgi:hypothetical protein
MYAYSKDLFSVTSFVQGADMQYVVPMVHCDKGMCRFEGGGFLRDDLLGINADRFHNGALVTNVHSVERFKYYTWYDLTKNDTTVMTVELIMVLGVFFVLMTLWHIRYMIALALIIAATGVITADEYRGKECAAQCASYIMSVFSWGNACCLVD